MAEKSLRRSGYLNATSVWSVATTCLGYSASSLLVVVSIGQDEGCGWTPLNASPLSIPYYVRPSLVFGCSMREPKRLPSSCEHST